MDILPQWIRILIPIMMLLLLFIIIFKLIQGNIKRERRRARQHSDILLSRIETLQGRVKELEALLQLTNQDTSYQSDALNGKKVFISYSSKDYNIALAIRDLLIQNNIPCFMAPESIPAGSNYTEEIPAAICDCFAMVILLSKSSQDSKWVSREVETALEENVPVIPYQLDSLTLTPQFKFLLGQCQHIMWQPDNAGRSQKELISRLKALQTAANKQD